MSPHHLRFILTLISVTPLCAYGQSFEYPKSILEHTLNLLNMMLPILVVIATCFFVLACIQLIRAQKDEERTEGRKRALWGVITLFVLVSIWGIVALLQEIFLAGYTENSSFGVPDFIDDWDWDGGEEGGGEEGGGEEGGGEEGGGGECPPGWNDMSNPCVENPLL